MLKNILPAAIVKLLFVINCLEFQELGDVVEEGENNNDGDIAEALTTRTLTRGKEAMIE